MKSVFIYYSITASCILAGSLVAVLPATNSCVGVVGDTSHGVHSSTLPTATLLSISTLLVRRITQNTNTWLGFRFRTT